MRGKKAAMSANRRLLDAQEKVKSLEARLESERATHKTEVNILKTTIRSLRVEASKEATKIAEREIGRALDMEKRAREAHGITVEAFRTYALQREYLIYNACRFVSMTQGIPPGEALECVMTWMTGEDYQKNKYSENFLVSWGLPLDGWVANRLRNDRRWHAKPNAVSLDSPKLSGDDRIHKKWNPDWYSDASSHFSAWKACGGHPHDPRRR